ncbi:MAG: class I SAM-dependent methyltransferase [Myxococcota bacterium]|nr:class I SAM-dependent methyltransferase [Myxococcota bacterium]
MAKARTRKSKRPSRFTAKTADKHDLYQRSVQDVDTEVGFIDQVFRSIRKRAPVSLCEDFCGTALLCGAWVKKNKNRTAIGIDIDPKVLAWGVEHNLSPIDEPGSRITLHQRDVRKPLPGKVDVLGAFNFSYWIFKTRDELRRYFERCRKGLNKDGLFFLDAYGGWEAHEPMFERRAIAGGFTYIWDQDKVDPITNHILNHIHFEFRDGTKLDKAFSYDWRFWSLAELRELLLEAGFKDVRVYWDTSDDDDHEHYVPRARAENQPGWLAYLVAS